MDEKERTNGQLFDMEPYKGPPKERKKPESKKEKDQRRLDDLARDELYKLERLIRQGEVLTANQRKALDDYRIRFGMAPRELPPGVVRTQREVVEHFGKHVQTVKNWCAAGAPRGPDSYDLKAIAAWAIENGLIEGDNGVGTDPLDPDSTGGQAVSPKTALEIAKLQQQILKLEIDNKRTQEEYLLREDVEKKMSSGLILSNGRLSLKRHLGRCGLSL